MKSNKITLAIVFFAIGLFSFTSLQAQEAKTFFINIPDSLCPLLTKVNRGKPLRTEIGNDRPEQGLYSDADDTGNQLANESIGFE